MVFFLACVVALGSKPVFDTRDAQNFFEALDAHAAGLPLPRALRQYYFAPGSEALHDFNRYAIGGPRKLARAVKRQPDFYRQLRERVREMEQTAPQIVQVYRDFATEVPGAALPPTTLLVGRFTSGGTVTDAGVLLGAEIHGIAEGADRSDFSAWFARVGRAPSDLPVIVAHELVHAQSQGRADSSLLVHLLNEGVADFIGERVVGSHINPSVYAHGYAHEAELWAELAPELDLPGTRGWLYGPPRGEGRPNDLGYFFGYRIAEAYYAQATDKMAAIQVLIAAENPREILEQSGYDGPSEPVPPGS